MEWRPFPRARIGPRSITSKLLVSLLLVTMVSVAAIGVVFWSHGAVRSSMRELTEVADPLDTAAHEMEINAIGSGLAVAQYLRTGDAAQRVRLDDDEGDFRRASSRYRKLADTAEERRLGVQLQRDYDDFRALGGGMIELHDRQQRDSRVAFSAITALHFDLERGLGTDGSRDPVASEDQRAMQASLGQLVSQLGAYIANGDRNRPRLVRSELRVLDARLAELRSRPSRPSELAVRGRVAARLGVIRSAVGRVLVQEARLISEAGRFNVLREHIDAILDGRAQVLARKRLEDAERRADSSFSVAEHAWLALGLLFVVLTGGALVLLARAVARPMSRLTAGTAAVAAGDLDHRIHGLKGDEFGLLAGHFNLMVERLQQTLVSKEALQRSEAELLQMTARLAEEASTDSLTALANRREFERRLDEAIADAAAGGREHVLFYLDLDQFKVINDTCGHAAGDELLRRVATVLLARLRPDDTVARLGGDEFGVILRDCSVSDGKNVAEQLRQDLHRLRFAWDRNVFTITVSIGLVPVLAAGGDSQEALAADAACYAAKDRGRNRVQLYGPDDSELMERQSQMQSIPRLTGALEADRFELDFQPIVPLAPDAAELAHYEVLVRMLDEAGNRVPPGAFIPAAERYGLMPRIDRWVVRTALAHVASRRPVDRPEVCAINLSGTSLAAPDMLEYIEEQLATTGVAPDTICFEITETAAMTDLASAVRFIERLKTIGCRFALDDFGSGMSSFAYLKHLPVDYLKIDGAFVRDIGRDPVAAALVESINNVGHIVGARTVAECVEDDATLQQLTTMGVDFGQGFGIARPRLLVSGAAVPDGPPPVDAPSGRTTAGTPAGLAQ